MLAAEAIVEKLLRQRGVEDFEKFLNPVIADLARPEELPGIAEAAEILLRGLDLRLPMVVFGDYDCDGICATAIMTSALKTLGARVESFIPRRREEGYGMSPASIERLLREHPKVKLVITVDNGINSIEQVMALKAHGIETIITDHHLPSVNVYGQTLLPSALAVVNPKVKSPSHLSELCGAAVAFFLANRLVSRARETGRYTGGSVGGPLLILAGLATVTDVMPLVGQNRILVAEALKRFQKCAPMGLIELYSRASRTGVTTMTSRDFGFLLGPRINASGRVATGDEALELLLVDDREIAREAARIVDQRNVDRKGIETRMFEEAAGALVAGASAQVVDIPGGHEGVAGIVAARLMDRVQVPVGVIAGNHGSARAPAGYNLRDALSSCSKFLSRFGGHAAAAGFSVKPGMTDEFRGAFAAACAEQARNFEAAAPKMNFDLELEAGDITLALADAIKRLEPFGEANPEPVFLMHDAVFTDVRTLGQEGRHLQLIVSGLRTVWWNHGDQVEALRARPNGRDITFTIEASDFGERHVELRLVTVS